MSFRKFGDQGRQKSQQTKEEEIYGMFMNYAPDEDQEEYEAPSFKGVKQQQAKLNFFQEEFSRPSAPPQPEQEQDDNRSALQDYYRKQAFLNFRKSNQTINANVSEGVKVVYQEKYPIKVAEEQKKKSTSTTLIPSALKKSGSKKKSVQFNETQNSVHFFEKAPGEFLTQLEKEELVQRIQMHRFGLIQYDEDEDERDGIEIEVDENELIRDLRDEDDQDENDLIRDEEVDEDEEDERGNRWQISKEPNNIEDEDFIITKQNLEEFKKRNSKFLFQKSPQKQKQKQNKPKEVMSKKQKKVTKHHEKQLENLYGNKALEMMKKMGYSGRGLGKQEQGIVAPVEAVMKTALEGGSVLVNEEVSDRIEKHENSWKKDKKLHKQLAAIQLARKEEREKLKEQDEQNKLINRTEHLKKVEMGQTATMLGLKIIDMTQENPVTYDSIENYITQEKAPFTTEKEAEDAYKVLSNQAMDLSNKIDKLYNQMNKLSGNIQSEKDKLNMFNFEAQQKRGQIMIEENKIENMKKFVENVRELEKEIIENPKEQILTGFHKLFKEFQYEYIKFDCQNLYLRVLGEYVTKQTATWKGPQNSSVSLSEIHKIISQFIESCKSVFLQKQIAKMEQHTQNLDEPSKKLFRRQNTKINQQDFKIMKRFTGYLIRPILNKLRTFIVNDWIPEEEEDLYLLDFLEVWSKTITIIEMEDQSKEYFACFSKEIELEIIDTLILPNIYRSIENWNNKSSRVLHLWLLPWYIYIQSKDEKRLNDLNKVIFSKMSQTLQQWQPIQKWGYHIISPWKNYLDEQKWESLVLKIILPKLLHMMNTDFTINPADQDLGPIKIIIQWSDFLTAEHLLILLEQTVFEKLQQILELWMDNNGNKEEMKEWLYGWQNMLEPIIYKVPDLEKTFTQMKALL